jgi:hypothetical protein
LATQFLMVAYDGAYTLMFLAEWREFPSAPCLARKKNLMTVDVEIARVA